MSVARRGSYSMPSSLARRRWAAGAFSKRSSVDTLSRPRSAGFGTSSISPSVRCVLAASSVEGPAPRAEWAARIHEFRDYVNRLADERDGGRQIDPELARATLKVWWKCFGSFDGMLAIPDVAAGEAGELVFIWKRKQHYLSIEMTLHTFFEVFYRNGRTGTIWGHDLDPTEREIPGPILGKLAYFVADE